jgi:CHAD domain-containing protein
MTVSADDSYRLLAARYLRKQVKKLLSHAAGARTAEDAEDVHQSRVASRRLRSALRVFEECFARGKVRRWRKDLRRFTRRLGKARDTDVQILFAQGVLDGLDDRRLRPGVSRLRLRLRQKRQALQPKVVKAADRLQKSGALDDLADVLRKTLASRQVKNAGVKSPFVFERSRALVTARMEELLALAPSLAEPDSQDKHHQMRIAAKRLRYTMELFAPAYDGALKQPIRTAKKLQTSLGDIHDCDVWVEQLRAFEEAERERTREYFGHVRPFARLKPGLEHLIGDRQARRQKQFAALGKYWDSLKRRGAWEHLAGVLIAPLAGGQAATGAKEPAPPEEAPPA